MDIQYEYNGCFDRRADYARQIDKKDSKETDDLCTHQRDILCVTHKCRMKGE